MAFKGSAAEIQPDGQTAAPLFDIPVDDHGTASFWFDETVELQVWAVKRGKPDYARYEVVVTPGEPWVDTFAVFVSVSGNDSLIGAEVIGADWQEDISVGAVWSAEADRPVQVTFMGQSVILEPDGSQSDMFRGKGASGKWDLRCALLPGEKSEGVPEPAFDRLYLAMELQCVRGD